MKLVRDFKEIVLSSEVVSNTIFVLVGDGKTERRRVLPPFCEKYNGGEKFLLFTGVSKGTKETGLEALNAIRAYITQYQARRFLFLIDREHFKQVKKGQEQGEISQHLEKELKARIEEISSLSPNKAFIVKGDIEASPFEVYIVIFGKTKNIEEELSELIKLKFGAEVEYDDKKLREFLSSKGEEYKKKGYETLIREAGVKYLEEAFPGLCSALKEIEEDC